MPTQTGRAFRHLITAIALTLMPTVAAATGSRVIDLVPGKPSTIRFPRGAVIHAVSAKVVDAQGDPLEGPIPWAVTVRSASFSAMVNLTSANTEFHIPRPMGLPVPDGDSLVVVAETVGAPDAHVRISVAYETGESAAGRLAVRAVAAAPDEHVDDEVPADDAVSTWTWTVQSDSRLVAISARQFVGATTVTLEDATSGEIIWRQDGPSRFAGAVAQLGETLRLGKALEGGRTYRLRVRRGAGKSSQVGTPVVMLVPRATQRAAADR